jgi:hypothetical protein
MTKTLKILASVAASTAVACGGAATKTGATQQPEDLPGRGALRLLGVNTAGLDSVVLSVESVALTLDGAPLAFVKADGPFELTMPNQAWLIGTFDLPANGVIHARVRLAATGTFIANGTNGAIDARGLDLDFEAPVAFFMNAHHAVFVVDVGKSLLDACPGAKMLVAQFKVAF